MFRTRNLAGKWRRAGGTSLAVGLAMKTKAVVLAGAVTLVLPLCLARMAHAARCSDGRDNREAKASDPNNPTPEEPAKPADECIERDIFFMPGTYGTFFQPRGNGRQTPFFGGGVQIAPFQWSRNNDRFGPSQGSMFLQVAMLQSPSVQGAMTLFEAGGTASFERNSSRRWLIPYFGGTVGGMTQRQIGTAAYVYPLAGVHLYWHRNLMVDAEGGYHFPFTDVDSARGPRSQLTARFSLW